jgi:hypothetical protein
MHSLLEQRVYVSGVFFDDLELQMITMETQPSGGATSGTQSSPDMANFLNQSIPKLTRTQYECTLTASTGQSLAMKHAYARLRNAG